VIRAEAVAVLRSSRVQLIELLSFMRQIGRRDMFPRVSDTRPADISVYPRGRSKVLKRW
jgi:hypothetical protein